MDDREPQEQFQHFVVDSKSLWSSTGGMNIVLIVCCFGGGGELSLSQTVSPAMEPFAFSRLPSLCHPSVPCSQMFFWRQPFPTVVVWDLVRLLNKMKSQCRSFKQPNLTPVWLHLEIRIFLCQKSYGKAISVIAKRKEKSANVSLLKTSYSKCLAFLMVETSSCAWRSERLDPDGDENQYVGVKWPLVTF